MIPKGMEMLMKSMGIDANAMMKGFQDAAGAFEKTCNHFNSRLDNIERRLTRIEEKLDIPPEAEKPALTIERTGTNG